MFAALLLLSFVAFVIQGQPFVCRKKYSPQDYTAFQHVPTNCLTTTPSTCQRSWKSGIREGSATSAPLICPAFVFCHESFSLCGYVPIRPETGVVLGGSGVKIGAGVDLGSLARDSPALKFIPNSLVAKIKPYIGLRQDLAACAAIEKPLELFSNEALVLSNAVKDYIVAKVQVRYNQDKNKDSLPFASLARGIRTAMVSVWYQLGNPEAYPTLWKLFLGNHWEKAVNTLRNFYPDPQGRSVEDLRRRNDEANIIEATLMKCNRALDVVLLLDESGSVSPASFNESLDLVKNITAAFPDKTFRGDKGARLAVSTFSNAYTPHFYLSSYNSQSQYLDAVSGIHKTGGTTSLGYALSRVADQFTEERGLRNERHGIPRVLIVVTDGKSHDPVRSPARRLHERNIVVYAVGVGHYDPRQLVDVASSPSHVYTLATFHQLESIIGTLTAATCNEPQPVNLKKKVEMTTSRQKFQYFVYKVERNSMLEIKVKDINGQTYVFVSRTNPHPYVYDNDLAFNTSSQRNKVLVISARERNNTISKRSVPEIKPVYVSVLAGTKTATFVIEGCKCNPLNCTEGTNEIIVNSGQEKRRYSSFFTFMMVPFFVFSFLS